MENDVAASSGTTTTTTTTTTTSTTRRSLSEALIQEVMSHQQQQLNAERAAAATASSATWAPSTVKITENAVLMFSLSMGMDYINQHRSLPNDVWWKERSLDDYKGFIHVVLRERMFGFGTLYTYFAGLKRHLITIQHRMPEDWWKTLQDVIKGYQRQMQKESEEKTRSKEERKRLKRQLNPNERAAMGLGTSCSSVSTVCCDADSPDCALQAILLVSLPTRTHGTGTGCRRCSGLCCRHSLGCGL